MGEPMEIPGWQLMGIAPTGTVQTYSNGIIEAGTIVPGPDGERFFYGTAINDCLYVLVKPKAENQNKLGKIFQQGRFSFQQDVTLGGVGAEVFRRTNATQKVLKAWLDIYLGALACAGGPLAMAITGMNLVVLGGKIKQNYQLYFDAAVELVVAKEFCRTRMPVFYRTVLEQLIFGQYENWAMGKAKDFLSDAVPGPKVAGKLVGVLLGQIGEDHLQQRMKSISALLKEVLIKVAVHCGEKREKLSETQIEQLSKHVIKQVAPGGHPPSAQEAKEIIRETERHAVSLPTMFKRIAAAVDTLD
ncbi:MAG: hypothetical protein M3209_13545 [Acidobacteriota bacterium]|nr:hypothetical protein [Acidobacteriota bacterium]